jgi:amino acid permease
MNANFLKAIAILVGTIIGAGILGIPAVIAKAGFFTGIVSIFFLGAAILILHLYLGEICLRTKKRHELTGYAEKYLGKWGKRFMAFSMVFSIYGALVAYLIGEGEILSSIFGGGNPLYYSIGFFIVMVVLVYSGLKIIGKSELIMNIFMIGIILVISILSFKYFDISNISGFYFNKLFIPYGVIFFAFIGTTAIPELKEILIKNRREVKKAIIIGTAIPIIIYALFSFMIIGVVGNNFLKLGPSQEIATIALGLFSSDLINLFANIFAIFSMATSFLALALALKWMFHYDYGINKKISWGLTVSIPFVIALFNLTTFVETLGIVGAVGGGIEGTLIVLMYHKAKQKGERKPEYSLKYHPLISWLLFGMFVFGMIYQLFFNL